MGFVLIVQPEAQAELADIHDHLESERPGLGGLFLDELEKCFAYIRLFPFGCQVRRGRYRHAIMSRFGYRVAYALDGDHVFVYQRHTSRKPSRTFGP